MSRFKYIPINSSIGISTLGKIQISDREEQLFSKIWNDSQKESKKFDGDILYYRDFGDDKVEVEYGPYRYWHGQFHLNDPKQKKLFALAVNGVIRHKDKVLLGRRTKNVTQNSNMLDFVPSGGVSRENGEDWRAQIIEELTEELSVSENQVSSLVLKGLLLDVKDCVADLMIEINIDEELSNIEPRNNEISELFVVDLNQGTIKDLSPSSGYIINLIKKESF